MILMLPFCLIQLMSYGYTSHIMLSLIFLHKKISVNVYFDDCRPMAYIETYSII